MSDQPLGVSVDTAVVPAPGYYPDPSVPGFVRYWNGGAWVPGTSRPAPADGEVLAAPAFAARPAVRPNARYIPPPAMPEPVRQAACPEPELEPLVETGPVFLDETLAGAVFSTAPAVGEEPADAAVTGNGWQANPQEQRGLMETGTAPRWVSWGWRRRSRWRPLRLSFLFPRPFLRLCLRLLPCLRQRCFRCVLSRRLRPYPCGRGSRLRRLPDPQPLPRLLGLPGLPGLPLPCRRGCPVRPGRFPRW